MHKSTSVYINTLEIYAYARSIFGNEVRILYTCAYTSKFFITIVHIHRYIVRYTQNFTNDKIMVSQ